MKTLGEKIFARDAEGRAVSRIGTLFFRTPGLVTKRGVHAMQRVMWLEAINAERTAAGKPPLTPEEEEAEVAESVDLIFTDDQVLIRPDPERMDLAMRADEELQKLVPKPRIRYLNTHAAKVRRALRERGENWRMARAPISQDDMAQIVEGARVAIGCARIYYYNAATGTRYITPGGYETVKALAPDAFRRQIAEIVTGLGKRNRFGQSEIDLFPPATPVEIRRAFRELKVDALDDAQLAVTCRELDDVWRMSIPAEMREESVENLAWRNEMCLAVTRRPNETNAAEQDMIAGISPEFYRQIEWLPGARIDHGEVVFDALYDEAARTQDPELLALCDNRVKALIFNMTRLYANLDYVNVGRIARSLARHPVAGSRRGNVYIVQSRTRGEAEPKVAIVRLQKWGVAERLDEGKDMLQAVTETDAYTDYVLDRRLMCLQLGMNLPKELGCGRFTERYRGNNAFNGCAVRTGYFVRGYVAGFASDKIPPARFRNPAFAQRFAALMGEAAALDLAVGRRSSVTREPIFDGNYEVVVLDAAGIPAEIRVTDHAGSFVEYERPFEDYVADYARVVVRRRAFVADYAHFAAAYVEGFRRRLTALQETYRARRRAFDNLFADRPYDTNGSGAYRWAMALRRLDDCDPEAVSKRLAEAVA